MTTYYVDGAVGDDANAGTSEGAGNAWATIDKGMNTVGAGDTVFVKASATYTENPGIDTNGSVGSPIRFEGYTTTPGDGGQASISGELLDNTTSRTYHIFKNFDIENSGGAGAGKCVNFVTTNTLWKNCIFRDNTALALVSVGNHAAFEECEFNDGVGDGVQCTRAAFVGCKFYRNQLAGIDAASHVICLFCEFFSNGSQAIDAAAGNDQFIVAVNNTIDGDSKDTTTGLFRNTAFHGMVVALNNIVYDCSDGMTWAAGNAANTEFSISRNNLLNSNTNDYTSGGFTDPGEVTAAPDFTDEASNDYTLTGGSPAVNAGYSGLSGDINIGAHLSDSAGGAGGGLLMANKRGGKQ